MCLTWKLFKLIVFSVCVACFSWQSSIFFKLYFAYPTATSIDLTFPSVLKFPAITFCNNNPVKREKFCAEYPYLCQKPNNLTNFCGNHPYFCKENVSNLVIPKLEYYASNSEADVRKAISQIYIHNISQDDTILKNDQDLYNFYTRIREEETVYPWTVSGIFLSIHSPFVPVNPFNDGAFLQIGHQYIIKIRMEEEHLLESPYDTNCTDYEDLWNKNN
ncbi:uncharacterized protein NPIL_194451 [Nephila pilipes]|uniref:Uncharacterized protein n=1 Tax=Nephila pilipes TaxID=299642 RepID=A0A8X6QCC7_NEPPI|nr:uncharacterized protein NPIL_194451 [Nephila pilipes]